MKISFQRGYQGRERSAILQYATQQNIAVVVEDVASVGCIPVGTVKYCVPLFGRHFVDFYPPFLLNREMWYADCKASQSFAQRMAQAGGVFVKRAGVWKDAEHPARLFHGEEITTPLPFWYSKPVRFVNEWRLYVLRGKILVAGWYMGEDEDATIPHLEKLDRIFPQGFSGAVDIGLTDQGDYELVEAQPPFACGWYGEMRDCALYGQWIVQGWQNSDWWKY
ncbi:DUF4343 domain-containing protein [bacterium]|nr:DUF4343 domain-containing protein [bacterium]